MRAYVQAAEKTALGEEWSQKYYESEEEAKTEINSLIQEYIDWYAKKYNAPYELHSDGNTTVLQIKDPNIKGNYYASYLFILYREVSKEEIK